jgi:ABC-type lipoprotein export system ATPase subunit
MILSAQSVTRRYGGDPGYEAVRDVSLDLHSGEFISIVGRSGSGKSTLLVLLGALIKPTQGRVLLDGTDLWARPEAELAAIRCRYIGFVFQVPSLLPNLTAVDNIAVPAFSAARWRLGKSTGGLTISWHGSVLVTEPVRIAVACPAASNAA